MVFSDFEEFFYLFYRLVLFVGMAFMLVSVLFLIVTMVVRSAAEA